MINKIIARMALALGAALAVVAPGVSPASAGPYDAEYVFGDSLSDRGNAASLENLLGDWSGNYPNPPSYHDSFTNGDVAVQVLAQSLGLNANPSLWVTNFQDPFDLFGGPSFVPGTNYAVAGATAAASAVGGIPGINLPQQVAAFTAFESDMADPSALYVIMIGGNDVRNAALYGTGAAAVTAGVDAELSAISTLSAEDAKNFLIVNVPDVGLIPEFAQDNPSLAGDATSYSQLYDTELAQGLAALDPTLPAGNSLDEFNLYALNTYILDNAASYGLTNTTDPCYTGDTPFSAASTTGCDSANIGSYVYWDEVHPTAKVQALWGEAMQAAIPEPSTWAMLMLGFAGLAYAGQRAARKNAGAAG